MKKARKKIRNILMLFFLAVFAVSAWKVNKIKREYRTGADTYSTLTQYVSFEETAAIKQTETKEIADPSEETTETIHINTEDTAWPDVNFEALKEINPDIVGWLYIENTKINYPVVQGSDNDYYLKHLFDGTYNSSGCIFLDAFSESDFTEKNNVIYGHHMKDGTMFYDLTKYEQQDFYDEHATALLVTPTNRYKILFFSGYVSETSSSAWDVDFSDLGYEQWLDELQEKSCFDSDVDPAADDRVATLSTCSYTYSNARFVLHGIIRDCGTY